MTYRPRRFAHSVVPSLTVPNADAAIEFYRAVFDAELGSHRIEHDGVVLYAEISIDGSPVMVNEELPDGPNLSPASVGGTPVRLHVHVPLIDEVFRRALDGGGEALIEPADQFYGERSGRFRDPFGHEWIVSTLIEELTPDQMRAALRDLL